MTGDGVHKPDCQHALQRIYFFIDNELDKADAAVIKRHIDECGPCLDEVAVERLLKSLIARSCTEVAPLELRQRVVFSIRQVQLEIGRARLDLE